MFSLWTNKNPPGGVPGQTKILLVVYLDKQKSSWWWPQRGFLFVQVYRAWLTHYLSLSGLLVWRLGMSIFCEHQNDYSNNFTNSDSTTCRSNNDHEWNNFFSHFWQKNINASGIINVFQNFIWRLFKDSFTTFMHLINTTRIW